MNKLLWSLLLLFLTISSAFCKDESTHVKIGDKTPDFKLEISKGKIVGINDYKGKVVLVNFFATWCGPCREELPHIEKEIWEKYKSNSKLVVLTIGREHKWEELEAFSEKQGLALPLYPDPNRTIFSKFATQSIPRSFLIDERGIIIFNSIGFNGEEFNKLKQLIGEKLK